MSVKWQLWLRHALCCLLSCLVMHLCNTHAQIRMQHTSILRHQHGKLQKRVQPSKQDLIPLILLWLRGLMPLLHTEVKQSVTKQKPILRTSNLRSSQSSFMKQQYTTLCCTRAHSMRMHIPSSSQLNSVTAHRVKKSDTQQQMHDERKHDARLQCAQPAIKLHETVWQGSAMDQRWIHAGKYLKHIPVPFLVSGFCLLREEGPASCVPLLPVPDEGAFASLPSSPPPFAALPPAAPPAATAAFPPFLASSFLSFFPILGCSFLRPSVPQSYSPEASLRLLSRGAMQKQNSALVSCK